MRKRVIIVLICFIIQMICCFLTKPVNAINDENMVLEEGTYEIEWTVNTEKKLDISAASTKQGANVQIWNKCNGAQQRFFLKYVGNGYYNIININSGLYIDVEYASTMPGANIQQWEGNSTDAQKWKIEKTESGGYTITSKCNNLYLNVKDTKDENGTNIEVNTYKNFFRFKKIETIKGTQTVKNGTYTIFSALNTNKVLDISEASKESRANLQIWDYVNVPQQKFYLQYDGKGYYTIKNINSGKMLDVDGARTEIRTNIQQYTDNSTDAQKWVIEETKDGYYNIISKVSGIYMEVEENEPQNGTNIHINFASNSDNQKFILKNINDETRYIKDGTYEITSKLASNMVVDVSEGSILSGANVQIWADANEKQQKFDFEYVGDGNYKILCNKSKKALTVSESSTAYNSNVYQDTYRGTKNQLWKLTKIKNNEYNIVSIYNNLNLDVENGKTDNGTNIRTFTKNASNSQVFVLEQKIYGIDVSHWQNVINFEKLKNTNRIDFMIIRAGQGLNIKDRQFERNYLEAKKYQIPIGVYLYANAQNVEEARNEAYRFLELIKNKSFELPVYYDVEAQENVDIDTITYMCTEFYNIIKNAGYKPGIYASKYYLLYKIDVKKLPSDCSIWVASYGKNEGGTIPKDTYKYYGIYDYWQYTSTGWIDGIIGDVDFNVAH